MLSARFAMAASILPLLAMPVTLTAGHASFAKAVTEPFGDLFHAQHAYFCRGKFNRQGNAVETGTDLGDGESVVFCQSKIHLNELGTLLEESDRSPGQFTSGKRN